MGIVFVLNLYALALAIAASVAALVLGASTYLLTRRSDPKRKLAVLASILFPFACVVFAGGWFVTYAIINAEIFHRDPGLGDSWETPLPNGYALLMIDTTDEGTVYNPKTQPDQGSVMSRDDTVFDVRQLQISKNLIFGASDRRDSDPIGLDSNVLDFYFELNTRTGRHTEFKSLEALRQRATSEGVSLNLRKFYSVYLDYRTTWFDYLAGAILLLAPSVGFAVLARWVWKIRRLGRSGIEPRLAQLVN